MISNNVEYEKSFDLLVMACGHTPRSKNIGLEKINVLTDERGHIRISDHCQTSVDNIFAIGDVSDKGPKIASKSVD